MINPNVLNEGNQMEILDNSKYLETYDECDLIVRCNNCGLPTRYGETRMCSGFVGCDNKITIDAIIKIAIVDFLLKNCLNTDLQ